MKSEKHPRYGADRPDLIVLSSIGVVFWATLGFTLYSTSIIPIAWRFTVLLIVVAIAIIALSIAVMFLISTRVMKFHQRDKLLEMIDWDGARSILDVGCGPGLLLIGGAKRAREAKAVGVDIWQKRAESGNKPERVMENARIEGVEGRIQVRSGDVRSLPFPDSTFDIVLSRAVLHNLNGRSERQKAIGEIVRVLASKGQIGLIIVDSWHLNEYLDLLRKDGVDIKKVLRPPRYFPSGLLFLTTVIGQKQ